VTDPFSDRDVLGDGFPGPLQRLVLALLLPSRHREVIVGDLIEEAGTDVLPQHGARAARRWFWRQALLSASPLYRHQSTREIHMTPWRWLTLMALFIVGLIMALDPYVFAASPLVLGLVFLAITIPAAAGVISSNLSTLVGATGVSALLLLAARIVSGLEIRWYAMAFMLFVILNLGRIFERRTSRA
jgi:hypothetical protein